MEAVRNNPFALRYFQPSMVHRVKKKTNIDTLNSVNSVISAAFSRLGEMLVESERRLEERIEMLEDFFEGLMFSQIAWRNWMDWKLTKKLLSCVPFSDLHEVKEKIKKHLLSTSGFLSNPSSYLSPTNENNEDTNNNDDSQKTQKKKKKKKNKKTKGLFFSTRTLNSIIRKILDRVFDIHTFPTSTTNGGAQQQVFFGCVFEDYFVKKNSCSSVKTVNLSMEKKNELYHYLLNKGQQKQQQQQQKSRKNIIMGSMSPSSLKSMMSNRSPTSSYGFRSPMTQGNSYGMKMLKSLENRTSGFFTEEEEYHQTEQKKQKQLSKDVSAQQQLTETTQQLNLHGYGALLDRFTTLMRKKKVQLTFYGSFKHGQRSGEGKEYVKGKIQFDGQYLGGLRHGKGILYSSFKKDSFVAYEGMFSLGRMNGRGEQHDPKTGRVDRGYWTDGVLEPSSVFSFSCPMLEYNEVFEEHLKTAQILGSGAYGIIYRVRSSLFPSLRLEKEFVAVKIMKCQTRREVQFLFRITKRGIGLCCSLQSENIISVHAILKGVFEVGYIMELCSTDVSKVIEASNHTMDIQEKVRILHGTAKGMKVLHDNDNVIKITDFDTLKEDERIWRLQSIAASSRIGTPGFLAPEVFNGRKYTLSCDVYAFGLMIYALLWEKSVPHSTQYQCVCGHLVENIIHSKLLDYHVANCDLRPLLNKSEIEKHPKYLMDLMISCWDPDPLKRPSFDDINHMFESQAKKEKCYAVILLQFPGYAEKIGDQIMLLIQPRLNKITDWVEQKFVGSKVEKLVNTNSGELLVDDEQIYGMIQEEDGKHVISVEIDRLVCNPSSIGASNPSSLESRKSLRNEHFSGDGQEEMEKLKKELEEVKEKFKVLEESAQEKYDELFLKYEFVKSQNEELKKKLIDLNLEGKKN